MDGIVVDFHLCESYVGVVFDIVKYGECQFSLSMTHGQTNVKGLENMCTPNWTLTYHFVMMMMKNNLIKLAHMLGKALYPLASFWFQNTVTKSLFVFILCSYKSYFMNLTNKNCCHLTVLHSDAR
jgi:hypothetical protein